MPKCLKGEYSITNNPVPKKTAAIPAIKVHKNNAAKITPKMEAPNPVRIHS